MKDFFRNLFGVRQKRKALPVSPAPKIGASIVHNGFKIKLAQSCDDELWDWLLLLAWRVCCYRNDRRQYIHLPPDTIVRLKQAGQTARAQVLDDLLEAAKEAA